MVFQELSDAPPLTVAENICLGRWPTRRGRVDWSAARRQAVGVLGTLGSDIDPDRPVGTLRIGERQMVEIARALQGQTRCLILDEPTAALSAGESSRLFETVRRLRDSGVAIIYITHRLDEVRQIASRVQVLRDGWTVLDGAVADHDKSALVEAMVGRSLDPTARPETTTPPEDTAPMLRLRVRLVGIGVRRRRPRRARRRGRRAVRPRRGGHPRGRRGDLRRAQPVVGLDRDRRPPVARAAGRPTPHGRASGWSPATVSAMVCS